MSNGVGGRAGARESRARSGLSTAGLTSLVDTVFLLLFSLLALSETRRAAAAELVRIKLPEVEPGSEESAQAPPGIALEIGADSIVRLRPSGEEILSRDQLDRYLAGTLAGELPEEVVVELHADRDARHGAVVELLAHLRTRGFLNVQLLALGVKDERGGELGGAR
jgi:biopolymer transport protein ExbD